MTSATCDRVLPDFDTLAAPLPAWNPKRWYYALIRGTMATIGRLSEGVSIGERYGYDSGVMLEHVYRNEARGRGLIGKLIDRAYLNAPGWTGIRARGALMTETLRTEINARGGDVRLLDVACGGGRYVLQALRGAPASSALLRDYRRENIESAAVLAKDLGVSARFEQADAFSDDCLAAASPRPNLIVVSGLHEIISDDALIENHFRQLAKIADKPATLVFTIQPWHPQLEFIARVLKSHTGAPWVMRLRPWEKTKRWCEAAGFKVRSMTMEPQGIFGVVVADLA